MSGSAIEGRGQLSGRANRLFGVTGRKNAGKTTLVARLVKELTGRGLCVATIKHAHHAFAIDREGTDSHAHRVAGAAEVMVGGGGRWALMHEGPDDGDGPTLAALAARLSPADIVLVEGFKREPHPKVELRRGGAPLGEAAANVVAVVGDGGTLGADDVAAIADLVLRCAAPL